MREFMNYVLNFKKEKETRQPEPEVWIKDKGNYRESYVCHCGNVYELNLYNYKDAPNGLCSKCGCVGSFVKQIGYFEYEYLESDVNETRNMHWVKKPDICQYLKENS